MIKNNVLITEGWNEYELLDSGEGRKLERFKTIILDRPDPQALWKKSHPELWESAHARFVWKGTTDAVNGGGKWMVTNKKVPENWNLSYDAITLTLALGKFKHIGIFPEHATQWKELHDVCQQNKELKVLNLFGYTGAASIAAALGGGRVTHVDASKQTISTVKENTELSGLPKDAIRLICEDALKYVKRLIARGEKFEVVVMDPPAFGRGPKGEIWKIEEKLHELLSYLPQLLSPQAKLVIVNGYAAGFAARTFGELLSEVIPHGTVICGDVGIKQKNSDRILSTGIYAKWQA